MPQTNIFVPITKIDVEKREVWGTLAEEVPDKSREIFDYEGSKPYFQKWNDDFSKLTSGLDVPSLGNVREMHTKSAAGKFINMNYDDDSKKIHVGSKIVDNQAWEKCVEGVYTGFSIGGDYIKRFDDPTLKGVKRYIAKPTEGSLVDNPCMYGATFTMCKSDGTSELRKFVGGGEELQKMVDAAVEARFAKGKTKRVDNTDLGSSAFLIVGSEDDPSTWHLPVNFPTEEQTVNHIHAAMGRVGQVEGVSHQVKSGAARRLAAMASKHGIEVKEFNQKFLESTFPRGLKKTGWNISLLADLFPQQDDTEPGSRDLSTVTKLYERLADEEASELAKEAQIEVTKGGGPNMSATATATQTGVEQTPEQLKKEIGDATEVLKKRNELLAKAADHFANLSKNVDKMQDTHGKMGEHVDAMCSHVDKSAGPLHKHATSLRDDHKAMGEHLDKMETTIEEFESATEAEVDKEDNQKVATPRLLKRLERGFEKRLAAQRQESENLVSKLLDAFEKLNGRSNTEPAQAPVPARTFVAPEKNADAAGVGGVVLAKGATPGGAPVATDGNIPPVDANGMPNPAYLKKLQESGSDGSEGFIKVAKKVKLQSGNPFPKEFGSNAIY